MKLSSTRIFVRYGTKSPRQTRPAARLRPRHRVGTRHRGVLGRRLRRERGELPASVDPAMLASFASAVLHSLAIRARAGEPRAVLEAITAAALDLMFGPAPPKRRRAR